MKLDSGGPAPFCAVASPAPEGPDLTFVSPDSGLASGTRDPSNADWAIRLTGLQAQGMSRSAELGTSQERPDGASLHVVGLLTEPHTHRARLVSRHTPVCQGLLPSAVRFRIVV